MNKELVYEVEQDEGMFVATCHNPEMATQGETLEQLIPMIGTSCNAALILATSGWAGPFACISLLIRSCNQPLLDENTAINPQTGKFDSRTTLGTSVAVSLLTPSPRDLSFNYAVGASDH